MKLQRKKHIKNFKWFASNSQALLNENWAIFARPITQRSIRTMIPRRYQGIFPDFFDVENGFARNRVFFLFWDYFFHRYNAYNMPWLMHWVYHVSESLLRKWQYTNWRPFSPITHSKKSECRFFFSMRELPEFTSSLLVECLIALICWIGGWADG